MMHIKTWYSLFKDTFNQWSEDKAPRMGAALAYYSVFSIAPLLIIAMGVASLVFNRQTAREGVENEIKSTVGAPVAAAVQQMLSNDDGPAPSIIATIIGVVTLLIAAMGVFGELQDSLNTVWKVKPKPGRGVWGMLRDRFFSFAMVLGTGFLLLVSLVLSTALSALSTSLSDRVPSSAIWQVVHVAVSFGVVTFLFALIFKFVPDAKIGWRDVWVGAVLTAFMFTLGKFLLGWYLGQASTTSQFGAAGSLAVILLWVYYASQILLFGAEFTRVYSTQFRSAVPPAGNAEKVRQETVVERVPGAA